MNTVIYHSADFDGIFCREIAKKFLPDATLIGWNFGDSLIPFPKDGIVYILDLSPDCLEAQVPNPPNTDNKSRMIWIDHHKTSIEKWSADIPGYRIDGVAACRLAWQWFKFNGEPTSTKEHFVGRIVSEPLAVQLAGEYDIWDKRNPWAETFQYSLRAVEPDWTMLLLPPEDKRGDEYVLELLKQGDAVQKYAQNVDASICKSRTWLMEWENLNFLCVNSARFNSLFFAAKDVAETNHNALLGFCFDGKGWTVSLYHAKHRTDIDLSVIAKKYGGGGHRGACGFTCKTLPFAL